MKGWPTLLLTVLVLSGCESLNDSVVRVWFQDRALGHRVHDQIREGLQRRLSAPPAPLPKTTVPAFLDQG